MILVFSFLLAPVGFQSVNFDSFIVFCSTVSCSIAEPWMIHRHRAALPSLQLCSNLSCKVLGLRKGHLLQSGHHIAAACLLILSWVWHQVFPEREVYVACLRFGHLGWVLLRMSSLPAGVNPMLHYQYPLGTATQGLVLSWFMCCVCLCAGTRNIFTPNEIIWQSLSFQIWLHER